MKKIIKQYIFFLIAGIILVAGFVFQGTKLILNNPVNSRIALDSDAINTISLSEGKYNLLYEYNTNEVNFGIAEFKKIIEVTPDMLNLKITAVEDQQGITFKEDQALTFSINKVQGKSLFSFNVDNDGVYDIELEINQDNVASEVQYSLAADFSREILKGLTRVGIHILISIPFLLLGIYMLVRESKAKSFRT